MIKIGGIKRKIRKLKLIKKCISKQKVNKK